jgi:S1-C subfamily serine protease
MKRTEIAISFIIIAAIIPRPGSAQPEAGSRQPVAGSREREAIRGWVGVAYTTSIGETDRTGAMVFKDYPVIESIEPNSPAEKAGLAAGDTIIAMNAQDLKKSPLPMAAMIQPGRRVIFRFKRNDTVREVTVTVAPRPVGNNEKFVITMFGSEPEPGVDRATTEMMRTARANPEMRPRLPSPMAALPPVVFGFGPRSLAVAGAEITALNAGLKALVGLNSPGIFVVNVALGTPASESGLTPADVILKADSSTVGDPGDLIRVLRESNGTSIRLRIFRNKKPQTITLRW